METTNCHFLATFCKNNNERIVLKKQKEWKEVAIFFSIASNQTVKAPQSVFSFQIKGRTLENESHLQRK